MTTSAFIYEPDPENPGWMTWDLMDSTRFNPLMGKLIVRSEGDDRARVRMFPKRQHSNLLDNVHGGVTLAFIDIAMFAASRVFGLIEASGAVTLDLSTQFIGGGRIGEPMDAEVELLRETGRLLFLRGLIVQGDHRVAAFAGTIRKPSRSR